MTGASVPPNDSHANHTFNGVKTMQKERKKHITKKEFYALGGFANSELFRKQSRGGAWRYYKSLDHSTDVKA